MLQPVCGAYTAMYVNLAPLLALHIERTVILNQFDN
jgi:hypothetical protein